MSYQTVLVVLLGLTTLCSAGQAKGKNWALVVAGSNGWYNYRHQADACHAYQVLHNHGIPDENIVVMMYDDIANNPKNKNPGVIINRPGGSDVYHGVPKDYTKLDVTASNFLSVLKGDKEAMKNIGSGKVIDSGPDDHVFVFFTDHGATGLIAFPNDELMASDLNNAIKYMHTNKKYQRMVLYIEACESGSMFDKKLPDDIKVFATTASNPDESSYACYWDKKLQTYLGDVYSVKWMEDSDKADLDVETLLKQFTIVKQETNTSHVMKYGDMSFDDEVLDDFQGEGSGIQLKKYAYKSPVIDDAVPSPDVPLMTLKRSLRDAQTLQQRRKIMREIEDLLETNERIKITMQKIASLATMSDHQKEFVLTKTADPRDFVCYKQVVRRFAEKCFNFAKYEHAIRHVYVLSNLCEESIPVDIIMAAMDGVCGKD